MKTREEVIRGYDRYLEENEGREPNAILALVRFYEDNEDLEVLIKLDCDYEATGTDEMFFFYAQNIHRFLALVGEESRYEDFYVKEVFEFINTKEKEREREV